MENDFLVVALLTIRHGEEQRFHAFECAAAAILRRHGGAIERNVLLETASPGGERREVHLVRFRDRDAFERYRADPDLAALAPQRAACVAATELLTGRAGPLYDERA